MGAKAVVFDLSGAGEAGDLQGMFDVDFPHDFSRWRHRIRCCWRRVPSLPIIVSSSVAVHRAPEIAERETELSKEKYEIMFL
jgi:hypothetical protein